MDIFQHTWGQTVLIILIQLLYFEISTVNCFAWHSPSQARSQTVPAETHIISQRWHQSVPKWYPYNMWKRRKRKELDSSDFLLDISATKRSHAHHGKMGDRVSKYQNLLDKLSRKANMNSILMKSKWKNEEQSMGHVTSFYPEYDHVASTAKTLEDNDYLPRKQKSHFGNIGSVEDSFSSVKPGEVSEEKKKLAESRDSGFGETLSGGFGQDDGFKSPKTDDGFSSDFLPTSPVQSDKIQQHEADTAAKTSTGFGNDPFESNAGSWGDSAWSDSGSLGGDGFGTIGAAATDSGSWGQTAQDSDGFAAIGRDSFSNDNKDCDTILTKSCADNSECSCYGFYICTNQRCEALQSTGSSSSSMSGGWQEGPVNFGFSKRKDPRKVIQIFMLPWQPQK